MSLKELGDYYSPGKDYFAFNLKFLFLVGLWPSDRWSKTQVIAYRIYQYILHILPIIYITITAIGTYQHAADLTVFISNLDKNVVALNFILKYVFFTIKHKEISILICEIMYSGDKISKQCNRHMSVHTIVLTGLSLLAITAFSGAALLNREMVVEAWVPFDPLKNMKNLLLFAQIAAATFTPCTVRANAMQGLLCSLIMYLCEQLVEIQRRIRALTNFSGTDDELRLQIKEIIKKHVRIMGYSKSMRNIFKEYLFVQNFAITVELCLNALMVAVVRFEDKKLLFGFFVFLCIAIMTAYVCCYLGNELMIQSEGIAQAAYDVAWTSWPVGLQKDLLFIIRIAQKPLTLSAGGIANLSMHTFGQALYNAYTVFAVLIDVVD
ncbi:odorant receptor 2a-like [Achroia grisella]|uniref:odorant receptor 2a-like n=1 Tax=Achroia grisella TaxID=688607 RepID=UPI0027D20EA6|nr:odorant receptor 2a-like [Achroia grisella]